jgi:hypothetical protein
MGRSVSPWLTVDVRMDALMGLRGTLNAGRDSWTEYLLATSSNAIRIVVS